MEFSRIALMRSRGLPLGMDDKAEVLDTSACCSLGISTAAARRATAIKLAAKEWSEGVYGQDLSSYLRVF
jgi:hypothetical protein